MPDLLLLKSRHGGQEEGRGLGLLGRSLGLVLGLDHVQVEQVQPARGGQVGQRDQVISDLQRRGELLIHLHSLLFHLVRRAG